MKAILIGVLSSVFFAVTFILNRSMELSGGSWLWSSSLRYFFMVPFLVLIVYLRGNLGALLKEMKKSHYIWLVWSIVGFGLFYGPITFAASSGPGWLVAGTWQFTIIAGLLLVPFFYTKIQSDQGTIKVRQKLPWKGLLFSSIIFIGIVIIQLDQASGGITANMLYVGILPVVLAAFSYPLGNRKMMEHCKGNVDTFQRVLGMTLASMPLWIALASYGYFTVGLPSSSQVLQSLVVALSSGVIATVLFFYATDLVKEDQSKLAAVEATQSSQIMFVLFGEMLLLSVALPNYQSIVGMFVIIIGMIFHSFASKQKIVLTRGKIKSI
ncbi:multidrug resistance efflux transporter family protein [Cytobacillus suaedae]|nr:multidrug resistance efflux transporter family protein [Cytobacillus suaedae]